MSIEVIDPNYNWKQAAAQEGVDYAAVQKSFMDQSYGVVANKAKILFQDPFRLGFEIVHRNEKATKMVGIFAFRINGNLFYIPTFFVNGEIKPADMIYRSDVKRFVPNTDEWCEHLVRGVDQASGDVVDKNRPRQADAYMDRLAAPQRVKYASEENEFALRKQACQEAHDREKELWHKEMRSAQKNVGQRADFGHDPASLTKFAADLRFMEGDWAADMEAARDEFVKRAQDGSLYQELLEHSADNSPIRKILPEVINEHGAEALEKLASMVEDSPTASRFLVENYTRDELETIDAWLAKEATGPRPAITITTDPGLAKEASAREEIFKRGYSLQDYRDSESLNAVTEEIAEGSVQSLKSTGKAHILLEGGDLELGVLLDRNPALLSPHNDYPTETDARVGSSERAADYVYFPESKQLLCLGYSEEVFGEATTDDSLDFTTKKVDELSKGKCYLALDSGNRRVSEPFCYEKSSKDGESIRVTASGKWGDEFEFFYAPDRTSKGRHISDDICFLEVDCKKPKGMGGYYDSPSSDCLEPQCDKILMDGNGLDKWMRTAGSLTGSNDVTVNKTPHGLFDITHTDVNGVEKKARDLGMLEAHLKLAEDFSLHVDKAGEILDKASDDSVSYRVYDTLSKQAFLTRPEGMENWIESFDPELQVRLDAPQQQVLSTHTPERAKQVSRYGDTYQRVPSEPNKGEDFGVPMEAILSSSPEELAQMSEMYDLPHIFDHGCVGQMAEAKHNIVDQIKKYVPDIEQGVDRYFRILFLLRYRPGDFEEHYGKDDLVEFENDLTELAAKSGDQLLKLLQRFEVEQYSVNQ